eukprot:scaffold3953_cov150-Chaetoceros_neogracile.AAC.1
MAIISFNVDHMKNRCDVILKTVERVFVDDESRLDSVPLFAAASSMKVKEVECLGLGLKEACRL